MKLSKLLLLLLSSVLRVQSSYNCTPTQELTNCGALKIVKTEEHYRIRAQQCTSTSGNCAIDSELITCSNICNFCIEVPALQGCGQNKSLCEKEIDQFLMRSCQNTRTISLPPTQEVISRTHCINTQPVTTVTVFKETPTNCISIVNTQENSLATNIKMDTETPTIVLGVLAGTLIVALAVVLAGWVLTCLTMIKKNNKRTQPCKKCQKQESEEERFCPEQLYDMTTTEPVVGTATEQLLHSLEESGQRNNGLSSKDNKGYHDVKRVENFYTSSEGSTQSSLQEEQEVNRVKEGESGEKHVYHVLEKPGGGDYEDPDKDLEENTAMEYETPMPLKELRLKPESIHTT